MKYVKSLIIILILSVARPALAADDTLIPPDVRDYLGYGVIMAMLILFIAAMLVLNKTFKALTKVLLTPEQYAAMEAERLQAKAKKPKGEVALKLLSLKPMSEEKSILIEHDYDGIQELDNPTPAWFMYLFYASIVFAVGYILTYHVLGVGQLQDQEYVTEMKIAAKEKEVFLANAANQVDEKSIKLSKDPAMLSSGVAVFKQTCAPCHGEHAQGMVGPNLTDDYWLHGGKIGDVFKTIKYGVPAKGMPSWEKQLTPKQIADVANYIKSVHGTNPANAKEPQGTKETEEDAKPAVQTAMVVAH
ncbi:cbb3-type cytochrome c oxidase N-terminal domain-containing protein [Mucilaginibacter terrae]|uniref:Cytochrome c oxidase cbb3-type subunit 3 n=1 Tax=Mucilaginibacter terrae TaxID=1955052 RepID=A0ABU3GVU9_9SPHI|nr:cbb3-type cytochrome c oxidase N-terminal domain-containing protein [Mucilaginibacter terrae]MDT3403899.1 cytochrome c oxidase cbb3-type subunit 3 [Mucilaginibacter terrae]